MFKLNLILIATLLGCVLADNIDQDAVVLSQKSIPADADGTFSYSFDTSNGIQTQESGNSNGATGAFQYVDHEGNVIKLTYTADENGYHPVGDHLPTPPPIPEAIARALEYIASHPPQN